MTTTPIAAGPNDVTVSRDFKRETRYVVFKLKDIERYLPEHQAQLIKIVLGTISAGRAADGKAPFNAVVVEKDWPEFEPTWKAIEERMTANADVCGLPHGKEDK
jgi:hypothetical protein